MTAGAGPGWGPLATLGAAALVQAAAAAYLAWGLPRLGPRAAAGFTALAAAALVLAAGLAPRGVVFALGLSSLLAGHLGWWLASARRQPSRKPVRAPGRTVRRQVTSSADAANMATTAGAATPPDTAEGKTLGRYRLERELGRGSMGAVYLGLDPQIGRHVAIKTLALAREFPGTQLDEVRARFFREAEMAGRLQHPGIVTIFDAGEDGDLAYIAMEYVKGRDLLRHTRPGQLLPLREVLEISVRVAEALAYAHRQGVVHRDIKPANVMVDAATASVKVTDFGIARITDHSRTRTGVLLGTPSFMSPEQMSGQRVDGRSDLYSLGVMLFQLLTGALPHASDSMAELMYQIANETAPDVRSLRAELPEALADIVSLALLKRPELRYADGLQMAQDLRAVIDMLGPSANPYLPPGTSPDMSLDTPPDNPPQAPSDPTSEAPSIAAPADAAAHTTADATADAKAAAQGASFEATMKFGSPDPRHNPVL